MSIKEAISQVQEEIIHGTVAQQAVNEAAEDFDLNPVLVARKFEEQNGHSHFAHGTVMQVRAKCAKIREEAKPAVALKSANSWNDDLTSRYGSVSGKAAELVGKKFTMGDEDYLFVGLVGNTYRSAKVKCVRVRDNAKRQFKSRMTDEIIKLIW